MKALVTVNNRVHAVSADNDEDLLMLVKDELINDLDKRMDAISDILHDDTRGNSESTIHALQEEYEILEADHDRIRRSSSLKNLGYLGYSIQLL